MLDCGSGSLQKLAKLHLNFLDIYYIFVSHLHPDHIIDLVPLLFALRNPDLSPIQKEIIIIGGKGIKQYFNQLKEIYGPSMEPPCQIKLIETVGEELSIPKFSLKTVPVEHLESSVAIKIVTPEGKKFLYSGDTDYCQQLVDLSRGVDLALLECSFPEGMKAEGHLTPKLAGKIAAEAGCPKIILTHLYPQCDSHDIKKQCQEVYAGEIVIAQDGMRLHI